MREPAPPPMNIERESSGPWKPSLPDVPMATSKKWLGWAIGGVVFFGLLGGGYFAYSRGYLKLFSPSKSTNTTASGKNDVPVITNSLAVNATNTGLVANANEVTNINRGLNTNFSENTNLNVNQNANTNNNTINVSNDDEYIVGCYLNEHPDALKYFPESFKEGYQQFTNNDYYRQQCQSSGKYTAQQAPRAKILVETDADGDGLNLHLENFFGSSDAKTDTDGDGYSDLQEVENGYNPNGPGKL
ncbi:MAG: hypothetical protein HY420_00245 [Candidatus Kerfeldbacteria bacterium]|nr:hypothetical protein [Candidatus Kerfeldbacteria bacterium]